MKVTPVAELPGLLLLEPRVFTDDRGYFLESFHTTRYAEFGIREPFVQDNWSHSIKGTLRGLHYQQPRTQGKLVHVAYGAIWDVAVDIRKGSPTFAKWFAVELSADNHKQLWIPPGLRTGSTCSPTPLTSFTSVPTFTQAIATAACGGTTRRSASSGLSSASHCCRPKTRSHRC